MSLCHFQRGFFNFRIVPCNVPAFVKPVTFQLTGHYIRYEGESRDIRVRNPSANEMAMRDWPGAQVYVITWRNWRIFFFNSFVIIRKRKRTIKLSTPWTCRALVRKPDMPNTCGSGIEGQYNWASRHRRRTVPWPGGEIKNSMGSWFLVFLREQMEIMINFVTGHIYESKSKYLSPVCPRSCHYIRVHNASVNEMGISYAGVTWRVGLRNYVTPCWAACDGRHGTVAKLGILGAGCRWTHAKLKNQLQSSRFHHVKRPPQATLMHPQGQKLLKN